MKGWFQDNYIAVLAIIFIGLVGIAIFGLVIFLVISMRPIHVSVTGRVTDASGSPMAGIEVRAIPLPVYSNFSEEPLNIGDKHTHIAVTDKNGCYHFNGLTASVKASLDQGRLLQKYDIVTNASSYTPQKIHFHQIGKSRWQVVELPDFKLEHEAYIEGRIVDTKGCNCPDRSIQLVPIEMQDQSPLVVQKVIPEFIDTDSKGRFQFAKVPSGTYYIEAAVYPDRGFEVTQRSQNGPLVVKAGQHLTNMEFVFESPEDRGCISLDVVDALDDKPIEQYEILIPHVEISGQGSGVCGFYKDNGHLMPFVYYRKTQAHKSIFLIEGVSPGLATIKIFATGYADTRTFIKVETDQTSKEVIKLEKEGVLSGKVSLNGNPCPGVSMLIEQVGFESEGYVDAPTNDDGFYEYKSLTKGEYLVRCYAYLSTTSYSAQVVDVKLAEVEFGKTTALDFNFAQNATIKGSFSAPDTGMLWMVKIFDISKGAFDNEYDNLRGCAWKLERSGEYSIECLRPGTYKVLASCHNRGESTAVMEKSKTITVEKGQTAQVDFKFP
jgi:hypothetical protein